MPKSSKLRPKTKNRENINPIANENFKNSLLLINAFFITTKKQYHNITEIILQVIISGLSIFITYGKEKIDRKANKAL